MNVMKNHLLKFGAGQNDLSDRSGNPTLISGAGPAPFPDGAWQS
jgi:hypothetical protein